MSQDLAGRTVVITGATSDLGCAAAQAFAWRGAHVVVVGRDRARLRAAVAAVREAGDGRTPDEFEVDYVGLDDVRALAAYLASEYPQIDVLVHAARIRAGRALRTADGFELAMQVNHLAPFLLTSLVRSRLGGGLVVHHTRRAGRLDTRVLDHLRCDRGDGHPTAPTTSSSAATVLCTAEAARRWPDVLSLPVRGLSPRRVGLLVDLATRPATSVDLGHAYAGRRHGPAVRHLAAAVWRASADAVGLLGDLKPAGRGRVSGPWACS